MRFGIRGALLGALLGLVACGGASTTPAKAPAGRSAAAPDSAAPQLAPVSAPPELFAVGRAKNPAELLDTLAAWSKLPFDWRALLAKEEPGIERVLQLDAPLDVAAILNTKAGVTPRAPLWAIGLGLSSIENALAFTRKEGQAVRRLPNGVYAIGEAPSDCFFAAALGRAPARLVCGDDERDVQALLPYMTRGMPRESFGSSDLHVELRGDPVRARHGQDLRQLKSLIPVALSHIAIDVPRFDRAAGDALHAVFDEAVRFVDDFQRLDLDLSVPRSSDAAEVRAAVSFRGQTSWVTQTTFSRQSAAAPEAFWNLPKDATSASFSYPVEQKRLEGLRRTAAELVDGLLEHEKVPAKQRDQLTELVRSGFNTDAVWAAAQGNLPKVAGATAATGADLEREKMRDSIGWYVAVVEAKADSYIADLSKLVRLYNDAQLRRMLQKRAKLDPKDLPPIRQRGLRGPGVTPGSVAFEITLPPALFKTDVFSAVGRAAMEPAPKPAAKPAPAKPLPIVLVVQPDGERMWLGFSTDEKTLLAKIASARSGAAATLATREGLAELKALQGMSGGFTTLAVASSSLPDELASASERIFNALPAHGETPMVYALTPSRTPTPRLTWTMRVPRVAIEDLGAALPLVIGTQSAVPNPQVPPP